MSRILVLCIFICAPLLGNANSPKGEIKFWQSQVRKNPKSAKSHLNLGVAYHKKGQLKQAYNAYRKVIRLKSQLTPLARFYMAKVLEKKGNSKRAYLVLTKIDLSKLPLRLENRIRRYKNKLQFAQQEPQQVDEPVEEKRYSAFIDLSYGTNSNPAFESQSNAFDEFEAMATLSYIFALGNTYEIKSVYTYNDTQFVDYTSANTGYHDITIPVAYYTKNSRYRIIPEYIKSTYGGDDFTNAVGAAIDWSVNKDGQSYTLYGQWMDLSVDDEDTYDYLNGRSQKFKFTWIQLWESSSLSTYLAYNIYDYEDTTSIVSSYISPLLGLSYSHYWNDFDLTASSSYENKTFDKDSSGDTRTDDVLSTNVQLGWAFNDFLRIYLELGYIDNSSNDSDNSYTQNRAILGITSGI